MQVQNKKQVLFVGSFKQAAKDGSVGGQMFACGSLINSKLSDRIDWIKLDSTSDSNIIGPIYKRAFKALKRLILFTWHLLFSRFSEVLIFTADGFSFVEKGIMALMAKAFGKKVIFAPRSGIIVNDLAHSSFMRKFIPFVLKRVDIVICQGATWKKMFYGLINQEESKFVTIQNWINAEKYFELASKREGQRKREKVVYNTIYATLADTLAPIQDSKDHQNGNSLIILFLSWVDQNKGIFDLINAAAEIKEKHPRVVYYIAGDGLAMEESKALVEKVGLEKQFHFLGWVKGDAKLTLLAQADIYVLPSYFEGFPNSLMEAMATSLPVISTWVGSIPDIVSHGENGLLFHPGKVEELANTLDILIKDDSLRQQLGKSAKATIQNNNTVAVAIKQFEQVFELVPCVES